MKLKSFLFTFVKEKMRKNETKLQMSLDSKAKEVENLLAAIEEKNQRIRSLEKNVERMKDDHILMTAAQNKCKEMEIKLYELEIEVVLLSAQLDEMQEKLKVKMLKMNVDLARDFCKVIAVTVSALACFVVARKALK